MSYVGVIVVVVLVVLGTPSLCTKTSQHRNGANLMKALLCFSVKTEVSFEAVADYCQHKANPS